MNAIVQFSVGEDPVDLGQMVEAVGHPRAGATATFIGVVRNHDGGRDVDYLDYSAHPIAEQILEKLAVEISERAQIHGVFVSHRIGSLHIGDIALAAAVSAEHRAEAFDAVRDLVEEVKKQLPVWKLQQFSDGEQEWSNLP
ncbi:Molybdopterin synthase catalytic subunit 1 [Corynebacterium kalinowskii]|uniref:Molybdopterin synthase catalytic subunit 1 n=1 Tax=Corynebacterium kalinowskii TaxID=2675216 RepID=A0A6B8VP91_9CORY|nr:molybdenum cofactor biosynthesis protein MoaE [Corynebacterium kalinowskii]QGU01367.1 Molybdopterin synthase catalytic subunit 1 [Corynebacterium kalinowskii]